MHNIINPNINSCLGILIDRIDRLVFLKATLPQIGASHMESLIIIIIIMYVYLIKLKPN